MQEKIQKSQNDNNNSDNSNNNRKRTIDTLYNRISDLESEFIQHKKATYQLKNEIFDGENVREGLSWDSAAAPFLEKVLPVIYVIFRGPLLPRWPLVAISTKKSRLARVPQLHFYKMYSIFDIARGLLWPSVTLSPRNRVFGYELLTLILSYSLFGGLFILLLVM